MTIRKIATRRADLIAVAGLVAAVPLVYDIRAALTDPYFLDEAWVAASTKAPLGDAVMASATAPIGWALLLRLVPSHADERYRLIPLLFLTFGVVAAYAVGRSLGWARRWHGVIAGLLAGAAVLLLPLAQPRLELKQYTADAALTLTVVWLAAWAESSWSWRRLSLIGVVSVAGMLFSHVVPLAGAAALAGFIVIAAARRAWRRLVETLVIGAATAVGVAAVALLLSRRGRTAALDGIWANYFPSLRGLAPYLIQRLDGLGGMFSTPAKLAVIALFVAGVVTVARARRPVTALTLVLLPLGMVLAGLARLYPLLELRTSHFWFVTAAATAGIGLAGLAIAAGRVGGPRLTAAVTVTAVLALAAADHRWLRFSRPTIADIRAQVRYVEQHRRLGDVILVSNWAGYGFAHYWTADQPQLVPAPDLGVYWVTYPTHAGIVVARDRTPAGVAAALARAEHLATRHGPHTRIWLIRTSVKADPPPRMNEQASWRRALAERHVTLIHVGAEPVGLIKRPSPNPPSSVGPTRTAAD